MTEPAGIRTALRLTWVPFFSRFGRLTEVQVRVIPRVLAGDNLVVISPAASGKTEAVVAPTVERLLPERRDRFSILYVSPTRALVNDLFRRLQDPLQYLGLAVSRKTGDHPGIDEKKLPFALITTPESFDSLLCRHPRIFQGLSAVVLDELHLLDNTPRGDQLRVLLARLRLINPTVKYCALSATIDDPDIGTRYFPSPVVVRVEGKREIDHVLLPMENDWHRAVVDELRKRECRKVLCFFNARSSAEESAKLFEHAPFAGRVRVHHGSLTREVREDVETMMNRQRIGLLCCTSTLELGIDIGDIDAVVLVRPPFNVSSLLQRLGRGNRRRASYLFAVGMYVNEWERFLFETLVDCARHGHLYEKRYTPALSVIPQQVASYLFQRRRIGTTSESVRRVLSPLYGDTFVDRTFRQMIDAGQVQAQRRGVYVTGQALERQVESGKIHSNIQDKSFGNYEVYEVGSGRHIGTVFFVFHHFVLAGRSWELVEHREKERKLLVKPLAAVSANTKVFEGTGTGGYSYRFAPVLRKRLFPRLRDDQFPYFRDGEFTHLVHLLGSTYGFILTAAFEAQGQEVSDMDGKLLLFSGRGPARELKRFPVPELSSIRDIVSTYIHRLEDNLGSGAFLRSLPQELQVEDHMLTLDIAGLLEFLKGLEPVELPAEEVTAQIRKHIGQKKGE